MLDSKQVARIIRLADDGFSIRSISAATRLARETVRLVVKRHDRRRRRLLGLDDSPPAPAAKSEQQQAAGDEPPGEIGGLAVANELAEHGLYNVTSRVFSRLPERCPTCGVKGYAPCLACRLRRMQRERKKWPPRKR